MRVDMFKVVVERPRRNRAYSYGDIRTRDNRYRDDPDELPRKEGMRKPYKKGYVSKELNENLNPLRRFLEAQVGRRWDDVFSEICEHINVASTVQQHVRQHIDDFVTRQTFYDDKGVLRGKKRYWGADWEVDGLYVDPTGVLRYKEPKHYRHRPEHDPDRRIIEVDHEYLCLKGIWYEVWFAYLPSPIKETFLDPEGTPYKMSKAFHVKHDGSIEANHSFTSYGFDVLKNSTVTRTGSEVHAGRKYRNKVYSYDRPYVDNEFRFARLKRQLNTRDLRKAGLQNREEE